MVSVCTGLLGEEGRVNVSVNTRLFISRIPLGIGMSIKEFHMAVWTAIPLHHRFPPSSGALVNGLYESTCTYDLT